MTDADSNLFVTGKSPVDRVLEFRTDIASAIQERALRFQGSRRRQMLALSKWFSHSRTASELMGNPDALSICLPLICDNSKKSASAPSLDKVQIKKAFQKIAPTYAEPQLQRLRLFGQLAYPLILLVLCAAILIAYSILLVPEFEQMYDEFGISLPPGTATVIAVSHLVQRYWLLALVLVPCAILCGLGLKSLNRRSTTQNGWLGSLMISDRVIWARWAWHVAMLLEVGLQQKDAIAIAGQSCSRSWGRRQSIRWSQDLVQGDQHVSNISMRSDQSVDLLLYALRLRRPAEQAALLYDVASNYWDRDRSQTQWWVSWLTPVVICIVGSIVGFFLASLFLPLGDLISRLT